MDGTTEGHAMEVTSADEDSVGLSFDMNPCLEAVRNYGQLTYEYL